jgi:hypothetical protein
MSWSVRSVSVTANTMEQSPSCAADSFSAGQEFTCILSNPKVHCRIHKRLTRSLILSRSRAVQAHHPISWRLILILFSLLQLGSHVIHFYRVFPTKLSLHLFCPTSVPHAHSHPCNFVHECYLVQITDYKVAHYLVLCTPLLPRPS